MADDGGTQWPEITLWLQRLKLEEFCCGHGEVTIDGGGFVVHDRKKEGKQS